MFNLIWIKKQVKNYLLAALFMGGLLIAGSDGQWFPWANFAGIALLVVFAIIANRGIKKK